MFDAVRTYLDQIALELDQIPAERKAVLDGLAEFYRSSESKAFNFICTHNSRRSHLGQIWGAVVCDYLGIARMASFSGGTEATAMNPRIVAALERVGLVVAGTPGENPRYAVRWSTDEGVTCWSKTYSDPANPASDFCAVMTCTDADEGCPVVLGAAARISLPFIDPKVSDDTPSEALTYDARCRQIAREMLHAFGQV
jgi:hypothetical protein